MSWSHLQGNGARSSGSGVGSYGITAGSSIASGSYIVVAVSAYILAPGSLTGVTVADSVNTGNYTQLVTKIYSNYWIGLYALVANATGTPTITATCGGTTFYPAIGYDVFSYSGSTPTTDATSSALTSNTSPAPGSFSSLAGDLLLVAIGAGYNYGTVTVPSGYVAAAAEAYSGSNDALYSAYQLSSAGGSVNPTWTVTTGSASVNVGASITSGASGGGFTPWIFGDQIESNGQG